MRKVSWLSLLWAASFTNAAEELLINPRYSQTGASKGSSVSLNISHLRNNRGFAKTPGGADFDGTGASYPANFLPPKDLAYAGIAYEFPQYQDGGGHDNVLAEGQSLTFPPGKYLSLEILAAAEGDEVEGSINATYGDGSASSSAVLVPPFWAWPYPFGGDLIFPYHFTNESIDSNRSMVFQSSHWLDSTKDLSSIKLPDFSDEDPGSRLHIFAVSLVPARAKGVKLEVQFARSTQTWYEGSNKTQIFEATINNVGTEWVMANQEVEVLVNAPGVKTVIPGRIHRLRPGDQARVRIGVINKDGNAEGSRGHAEVIVTGKGVHASHKFNATYGISKYEPTYESIYEHESPPWFSDGKFGIFIHWGVYSVPGWGNVGDKEGYAEWYWWDMNSGPDTKTDTYDYHLKTYGRDVVYDDFIANFTADNYNPKEWVDLFADAGAQYFVLVSKHHDGFALFDIPEDVTKRTSVLLGPKQDLLQELFDAAAEHQPHLHPATYFSMPEWFHPDYASLGFGSWPGGNATNPYTNETLPYTGYVPVTNYIQDVQTPELEALSKAGTEIYWCDIGGPNDTARAAATYFNKMAEMGKQTLTNNRCGTPGDFDTPEYAQYSSVQARKWESNRGLDPFSYGYNRATPEDGYMKPEEVVTSLMDIVSKNGNFLLDVGPQADGTIIEIEQQILRKAGAWIHSHAEAIFNTTYWFVTPQEGEDIRFTQTAEAFYITALSEPNATLALRSPVPYVHGDKVTIVGGDAAGETVPSRALENGGLELSISDEVRKADQYAWVFKIDLLKPSDYH